MANMKDTVILPLKEPLVNTWAGNTYLFSIIQNNEESFKWINNLFIQILGVEMFEDQPPDFQFVPGVNPYSPYYLGNSWDMCPYINKYAYHRRFIKNKYPSFTEYLIESINEGIYNYVLLDQCFRGDGKSNDYIHQSLIYGYDLREKKFYIADHFNVSKFSFMKVDFDEVERAFNNVDELFKGKFSPHKTFQREVSIIHAIELQECDYRFDKELFIGFLKEYLLPEKSYGRMYSLSTLLYFGELEDCYKEYYGMDCYEMLKRYLNKLMEDDNKVYKDLRVFSFLKDHKTLMRHRVEYLIENKIIDESNNLLDRIRAIEEYAVVMLNVFLKYYLSNDNKNVAKIIKALDSIKQQEKKFIEDLIDIMEKN